jgi:UDP-glucose 4-epimerase
VEGFCTAVEAVLRRWAAGEEAAGAYVLGDAAPLSTRDMLVALREGLDRPPRLLPVPPALLAAALRAAGRGAIAAQLLGDLVVDSAAFRREFGWQPVADTRATLRAMARAG